MRVINIDAKMAFNDSNKDWFKVFYLKWTRRGYTINLKW